MTCTRIKNGLICHGKKYKAGDLPPVGYNDWFDWAKVQEKAGLRQVSCGKCGKVKYPQELSDKTIECKYRETKHGTVFVKQSPICTKCVGQ